ncbi:Endonuclease [Sphingomonas sp. EC-HK361]|uniref:endonuclease/exonuclease/phosphatase family protein n=1 Tax=Sphingomonas sp. EC-HK361 TaxID=2038397 RepID=UPI0012573D84|nr:endonuclease/exonuclease/phosphatase family protein [Sphingomonas sp. EC-HK361]VVS99374.1 Endonuclease [Sphingomonas sp. EC-HK361]
MRAIRWLMAMLGLVLGLTTLAGAACARDAAPLRVMTFNVRVAVASDGANDWPHRRDLFAQTIRAADPDLFGTQELKQEQADDIATRLPAYRWFGIDRRGGNGDEHMGIFYRPDRLKVIESGNFWLSDTPDVPGSITWGHPLPRMVTWALFERKDGRRFYHFNTHFPYRDEDEAARTKGAALILKRIEALPKDVPVVLTGDFNTVASSEAHKLLAGPLTDARIAAPRKAGPDPTFHDFTGNADKRIDWILVRGFRPMSVETVTTHRGALYPSDHFPVFATLAWK